MDKINFVLPPLLFLILVLLVAGCAAGANEAELAWNARQTMIGLEESRLLACAGQPAGRSRDSDGDVITYVASTYREAYPDRPFPEGAYAYDRVVGTNAQRVVQVGECRADFLLRDGRVAALNYKTGAEDSILRYRLCYEVVRNCIAP